MPLIFIFVTMTPTSHQSQRKQCSKAKLYRLQIWFDVRARESSAAALKPTGHQVRSSHFASAQGSDVILHFRY
jgi:hypothetical protein